jgi:DNA-binding NarL/FixJ family response regulator
MTTRPATLVDALLRESVVSSAFRHRLPLNTRHAETLVADLSRDLRHHIGEPVAMYNGRRVFPQRLRALFLAGQGLENPEIAEQMGLSLNTVKSHLRAVNAQLGARNRTHAVLIALHAGLFSLDALVQSIDGPGEVAA